jgi:DnaJ-class molecular chaperone
MSRQKYHKSAVQICGECLGEGEVWQRTELARHGSSDHDAGIIVTCGTCSGSGMVKVTRDVTITVDPHKPKSNG